MQHSLWIDRRKRVKTACNAIRLLLLAPGGIRTGGKFSSSSPRAIARLHTRSIDEEAGSLTLESLYNSTTILYVCTTTVDIYAAAVEVPPVKDDAPRKGDFPAVVCSDIILYSFSSFFALDFHFVDLTDGHFSVANCVDPEENPEDDGRGP